ncbi:MAG: STAS domain-containing protein [Terriglobales bacterium]
METTRPVVVMRIPERLNFKQSRAFWREIQPILTSDRPQIVFDMASVKYLDAAGVDMLLQCMAEVMKRDGDLKLAAVSPEAFVILELTRTDRFFEIYDSSSNAVKSFSRFLPEAMRHQPFGNFVAPAPAPRAQGAAAAEPAPDRDPGFAA